MEDVSKDRSVEEYLLRAEKIASTAELAAGVAHEINNPLGIVQNYLELLKLKDLDPDAAQAGEDRERGDRIEKIVGSLLSFSRVDDASVATWTSGASWRRCSCSWSTDSRRRASR